ncbi:tetratricopeptide repeat protein [Aquimarina sp. MAR_2010_214]|uniref:tetratricopeptide repeat protein n=1 Tax=Aquimarina sp. MAR_2010_214 TaxID=1250026 RepID=UPI000C705138|nr:tetratricopeptide repeat protein [Aquimarina sp. MAR_2010_214]PKV49792.1 tetratricopeptide repeat protein [Aquimarina sp. MAR_2010_214]
MKFELPFKMNYKKGFIILAIMIGFLMPFLSFDYGITEDARLHNEHGKRILDYFKGLDDTAALSPIDENGALINISTSELNQKRGMNGFGGVFDLLSNFLYQYFSFVGEYELRNIINSIFGLLLFLFCGLLGKELGGWRTGLLCFVFVILTPTLFGQAMYNPKDIPFAAFYIFSTFHIVKLLKELPKVTLKRAFYLILNISLLINIRLLGLVAFGYIFIAFGAWWLFKSYKQKINKTSIKNDLIVVVKITAICILAYIATSVFWPYLHTNPVTAPIELFFVLKEFKGFISIQLFEGEWHSSFEMPWYYTIKSLFIISTPLHLILGVILIPLLFFKEKKEKIVHISIILFASLFPILLVVLGGPNSYDNGRHFLFALPPLIVICGLSWDKLLSIKIGKNIKWGIYIILALLLVQPLKFMVTNHPFQSMYFSPIIGGVKGAYGNYEIDYWGVAIKPAIEWLEENAEDISKEKPARVRMYYGEQLKAKYYLDKTSKLEYVLAGENTSDWDYGIVMLTEAKFDKNLKENWPPLNTIHEIKVGDVPVCFIVKNDFKPNDIHSLKQQLSKKPTVDGYIELSLLYYNEQNYFKCIEASEKVIQLDSNNSIAYNNICSSYNMLFMYDEAKAACEKSLELRPDVLLTQNNLNAANDGVKKMKSKTFTVKEYLTLGYNYYQKKDYENCIRVSKEVLEIDPNNAIAYNNICTSYNALGEYDKAIEACNRAIEIAPDFKLAKNNIKFAKDRLSREE